CVHTHIWFLLFPRCFAHPHLPSFPTRRSSDLVYGFTVDAQLKNLDLGVAVEYLPGSQELCQQPKSSKSQGRSYRKQHDRAGIDEDRKSTRLNSSHVAISYAVFCLKKKKKENIN